MDVLDIFKHWLEENTTTEDLRESIENEREMCVYADQSEFEEGYWNTWDEYIDEVGGMLYGFDEVFEEVLSKFLDNCLQGLVITDEIRDDLFVIFCRHL